MLKGYYIEIPTERLSDDDEKSGSRKLIEEMIDYRDMTLTQLNTSYGKQYPDNATTQANLTNKLRRGGLRDFELARYANCCGFKLILVPSESISPQTNNIDIPIDLADLEFATYLQDGYATASTENFPDILIAGESAAKAKEVIEGNIELTKPTKANEMFFLVKIEKTMNVRIKLVGKLLKE